MCLQPYVSQGKDIYEKLREGMRGEGHLGNFAIVDCPKEENPQAKEEKEEAR
jgi:hypothetical protein